MTGILTDPLEEARRVVDAAGAAGVDLRLTGGVGIATIAPAARIAPLQRQYGDIDFVGRRKQLGQIEELFAGLGYLPEREFNSLHGEHRLFFQDHVHHREADVFLDEIQGCHTLPLGDRLGVTPVSLSPADLLLSKLQIIETSDKDYRDAVALLADHPLTDGDTGEGISLARIGEVCCADWGWWKTVTLVGERALDWMAPLVADGSVSPEAPARLGQILDYLEEQPKTRKWKLRARVGERVRWHQDPEAVDHV